MDYRTLFARRLRQLRGIRTLTLEAAAERRQLSGNFWGDVERGNKVPSLDTIVAMAEALRVPPAALLKLERVEDSWDARKRLERILDQCQPDQLELICRIASVVVEP